MNKKELVDYIADNAGLEKKQAAAALDATLKGITESLGKKDKVRVTVIFRGREITLSDRGRELLEQIAETVSELATVEQLPKFEGRTMVMVLAPR